MIIAAIQHWKLAYLCIAALVTIASTVIADHLRAGDPPATSTRCAAALTAGALWPAVVVGLAQLWALRRVVRHLQGPQAPPPVAAEPELVAIRA